MTAKTPDHRPSPPGLGDAGRAVWDCLHADIAADQEFSEREIVWLTMACKQADDLARLEAAIEDRGEWISGSSGQEVLNPCIMEARQARASLDRLLGRLAMPDEQGVPRTSASEHGQRAARSRWK